ncbi:hypothetical protein BDW75DRAFT_241238 [Aspergillus navahoensis]
MPTVIRTKNSKLSDMERVIDIRCRVLLFLPHKLNEKDLDGAYSGRGLRDVSRLEDVERIEGCSPAPIGGIFQMAMVLKDCPTLEMGYADWNIAVTPKVSGTWNIK